MGRKTPKNKKDKSQRSYVGVLDITRSGMGYVVVEGMQKDILVRPSDFNRAFHGDKVRINMTSENMRTGRAQGVVSEILERKQTEFIGTIEVTRDFAFFIADSQKAMPDFFVPASNLNKAKDGDRVIVKLIDWRKEDKNPKGQVISVLEGVNANDLAMKELLVQHGFPLLFDEEVLEESERIPDIISEAEIGKRKDIRDILTVTIDPADAKDFDDALSFREIKKGIYEVGVHIADVSHFVEPDTELG